MAILVTQDLHIAACALNGQVAGGGDSVQECHSVLVDGEATRAGDLTEDLVVKVHELDSHDSVVDLTLLTEFVLDGLGDLLLVHASNLHTAEGREIDHPVVADSVAGDLGVGGPGDGGVAVLADPVGSVRQVEQGAQLRSLRVDDDRDHVARLQNDVLRSGDLGTIGLFGVLEIGDVRRGGARSEKPQGAYDTGQNQ